MSQQAIVNPDELQQFAQNLKQFNAQLHGSMSRLQGQFVHLGETWRDQEHRKFAEEFQQTMRVLERFMRTSDEHIPFLLSKADRIRPYFQR